jgi:DNA (cytosine-5)-methyltransferase 1
MPTYYEFFAGGGMAGAGLGPDWSCLFANDFDPKKAASYAKNRGSEHLCVGDVASISASRLVGKADLAWASFPCQDLSLAGAGAGLKGERSGTFWPFWTLMKELAHAGRAPSLIALENVCGALTSHEGRDFVAICDALAKANYRLGAVVADAVHFVPQSRARLFIFGIHESVDVPESVAALAPDGIWHTAGVIAAHSRLSIATKQQWLWLRLPVPPKRKNSFGDLIEANPVGVSWHSSAETKKLIAMMSKRNRQKLEDAKRAGRTVVGTIYKRTRFGDDGEKVQRAEVRFDEVAGCLRTPGGGSSRQTIIIVNGDDVRTRLLSPREAARLMGLSDKYVLPESYNEAYHLAGDGVVVPVVRFLAKNLLEPILIGAPKPSRRAA